MNGFDPGDRASAFYTLWRDCGDASIPFGLFGGFATIEQLHDLGDGAAVAGHIDATFRKLAVVYGHLLGIRPIRLVFDAAHASRYRAETADLNRRIGRVSEATGLPLQDEIPCLYLHGCMRDGRLGIDLVLSERLNDPGVWVDFATRSEGLSNHLTTAFHLPLLEAKAELSGTAAGADALADLARRVFAYSDKGRCLQALEAVPATDRLPSAPTLLATLEGSIEHATLRMRLGGKDGVAGRVFLKPIWSGGGAAMHSVRPGETILLPEPRDYLVQAEVDTGTEDQRGGLPSRIGVNLFLPEHGRPAIKAVTQQLYRDPACLSHIGSILDEQASRSIRARIGEDILLRHAERFRKETGIVGPLGIDLVYDHRRGCYVDIHDANIRLTASAPVQFLHRLFAQAGRPPRSVALIGNDGGLDLPERDGWATLQRAKLLYCRDRNSGILPVPSYRGPTCYDAAFLNLDPGGIRSALSRLRAIQTQRIPDVFTDPPEEASGPNAIERNPASHRSAAHPAGGDRW